VSQPPDGIPATPWFLHQAAQAIGRDRPAEALLWIERAGEVASNLVRAALPELRQLARAEALARVCLFDASQLPITPGLLVGAVACLDRERDGSVLLDAAQGGDQASARQALEKLAKRPDLPAATAHHLALIYLRAALIAEEHAPLRADEFWQLTWRCWLGWAAQATSEDRTMIFDWLLGLHRQRIKDLLSRNAVEHARRHWRRVTDLSNATEDLAGAIARFRDDLATEYVVQAREAMRYGTMAGFDSDYEAGVTCLTRLLSLDRDNLRLLTELVVICTEWFQECYANSEAVQLAQLVDRFSSFALQLARLVDRSGGAELTGRAALAEFTKFRGFVAVDPDRKAALYREALRYQPSNENVKRLSAKSAPANGGSNP
jgi:hypothetical protein